MKRIQITFINMLTETNGSSSPSPLHPPPLTHSLPFPHSSLLTSLLTSLLPLSLTPSLLTSLLPLLDMTQEVASRGLGLVYEHSDSSQKESLVRILVGTLMEGRK